MLFVLLLILIRCSKNDKHISFSVIVKSGSDYLIREKTKSITRDTMMCLLKRRLKDWAEDVLGSGGEHLRETGTLVASSVLHERGE